MVNKADLLPEAFRVKWQEYFQEVGVDFVFFSAKASLDLIVGFFITYQKMGRGLLSKKIYNVINLCTDEHQSMAFAFCFVVYECSFTHNTLVTVIRPNVMLKTPKRKVMMRHL